MIENLAQNFVLIKQWQVQKNKEFKQILRTEAAGGICMLLCAVLAVVAFNSPLVHWYNLFIEQQVFVGFGKYTASMGLQSFTDDVLLIFFFAVVCMQLKRDLEQDLIEQKKQVLLSAFAAMGGMICPIIIYSIFNWNNPETSHGWAIPMSTDTAFAIAVLLLLGRKLPRAIKVFMLATAIFDDIGSIFIISIFYSNTVEFLPLLGVFACCLFLLVMNRANIIAKMPYVVTCIVMFFFLKNAGVETILTGVFFGLAVPLADKDDINKFPLKEALDTIQPLVSFFVLPLFAFVNAGVMVIGLTMNDILNPVTMGSFLGMFFGKQIGIFGMTYTLIKLKIFNMPKGMNFRYLYGVSIIGGIGFTMSIFISNIYFASNETLREDAIFGILMSACAASIYGSLYLIYMIRRQRN